MYVLMNVCADADRHQPCLCSPARLWLKRQGPGVFYCKPPVLFSFRSHSVDPVSTRFVRPATARGKASFSGTETWPCCAASCSTPITGRSALSTLFDSSTSVCVQTFCSGPDVPVFEHRDQISSLLLRLRVQWPWFTGARPVSALSAHDPQLLAPCDTLESAARMQAQSCML